MPERPPPPSPPVAAPDTRPSANPPAPVSVARPGRAEWLVVGSLFALGAIFRFWRLNAEGLWLDEITCWLDCRLPFETLRRGLHPVSLLLMKGSTALFGDSNAALRLPGVLCGLGAAGVLWWAMRREFGRGAAVFALLFASLSPYQIHYSRDANHYGPTLLFSALVFLLLREWLVRPRAVWGGALLLVLAAAFKTHPFNAALAAAVFGALGLWALRPENRARLVPPRGVSPWRAWVIPGAVGVAGLAVAIPFARRFARIVRNAVSETAGATVGYSFELTTLSRIQADLGGAFFDFRPSAHAAGWVVAGLAVLGIARAFRSGRAPFALFGALVGLLPHAVLATYRFEHFFHTRYLAFQSPVLLGFAALGLASLALRGEGTSATARRGASAWLAVGLLVLWVVNVLPSNVRLATRDRHPYEKGAEALARHLRPGDKVLCYPPWSRLALEVALERRGVESPRLYTSGHLGLDSFATLYRFGYLAWRDPAPLYYYASYRAYDRDLWPLAWDWLEPHLDPVFEQPSGYVEDYARKDYAVGVYRFRYNGRLVMPVLESPVEPGPWPRPLSGSEDARPAASPAAPSGPWDFHPLFLGSGRYAVEIRIGGRAVAPEGWRIEIASSDGREARTPSGDLRPRATEPEPTHPGESPRLLLAYGPDEVEAFGFAPRLRLHPPSGVSPAAADPVLVFGPPRREPMRLLGAMAVDFGPFRYVYSALRGGSRSLLLSRGAWADYRFHVPDDVPRLVRIAANPPGGGMEAMVEIDGRPWGYLSYRGATLETQAFPLPPGVGERHLRVFAGREPLRRAVGSGPGPREGHLVLTRIDLEPWGSDSPPPDDRVRSPLSGSGDAVLPDDPPRGDLPVEIPSPRSLPPEARRPW